MTNAEKEKELACEVERHRAYIHAMSDALEELVNARETIYSTLIKAIARVEDARDTEGELFERARDEYCKFCWEEDDDH